MGKLLSILQYKDKEAQDDLFVDFENAQPTDNEVAVWNKVQDRLRYAQTILLELQQYRGATNEIREAISNPRSQSHQQVAWEAVRPLVSQLKRYYEFSVELEGLVPELLQQLCSSDMTPRQHLETQQALFKQFAEILDFTLKFDDLKMTNPGIQNDFSYYRRTLNRLKMESDQQDNINHDSAVSNEMANRMSLFYAHATPMLKVLSDVTSKFVSENKDIPVDYTTECLGTMANICRVMIENQDYATRFKNEETLLFCLRVMVGVIILYDHVHPVGAFVKSSHIDIKSSIKVLRDQPQGTVDGLLNALRYTTKHLNDENTPKGTKALLTSA